MKKKYSLLLKKELVDSLLNTDKFIKIDIHNFYGNLGVAKGENDKIVFVWQVGHTPLLKIPFGPTKTLRYF